MGYHNKHLGVSKEDGIRLRIMYEIEEMTVAEIAKLEGCGLSTLRSAFKRFGIISRSKKVKTKKYKESMKKHWTKERREYISTNNFNSSKTQEEYIKQFVAVHGTKYDYSKVKYCGCYEPVIIVCNIHGDFVQMPSNHASGRGGVPHVGKKG